MHAIGFNCPVNSVAPAVALLLDARLPGPPSAPLPLPGLAAPPGLCV